MKKALKLVCLAFCVVLVIAAMVACDEPPHEHSWDSGRVTTEPTCSEKGIKTFNCSGCEETKTEEVDMIAHTERDIGVTLPTCTLSGLTAGKDCSVCGATIVEREYMGKLGHELDENNQCTRCSYELYTEGLIFETSGGGNNYTVIGYEGTAKDLIIPSKYNGLPVVAIAAESFKENEIIETIVIPDSVKSIGESAFYECTSLESIELPASITEIASNTFYRCKKMTSVTILGDITSIGESAFELCEKLGSIVIPDSCESIGEDAFTCCYAMRSVTMPSGLLTIGGSAFTYCESLESIVIPAGVKVIPGRAFFRCISQVTLMRRIMGEISISLSPDLVFLVMYSGAVSKSFCSSLAFSSFAPANFRFISYFAHPMSANLVAGS